MTDDDKIRDEIFSFWRRYIWGESDGNLSQSFLDEKNRKHLRDVLGIEKLEERYIYKTVSKSMFEDLEGEIAELKIRESDTYKDVSELKNHDIFKIWKSVRKGGKTTLTAILNLNQGIEELKTKIDGYNANVNLARHKYKELKEQIKDESVECTDINRGFFDAIDTIEEALRELSEGLYSFHGNRMTIVEFREMLASIFMDKLNGGDSEFCAGDDCRTCDIDRKECPIVKEMKGGDKSVKTLVENGSGDVRVRLPASLKGSTSTEISTESQPPKYAFIDAPSEVFRKAQEKEVAEPESIKVCAVCNKNLEKEGYWEVYSCGDCADIMFKPNRGLKLVEKEDLEKIVNDLDELYDRLRGRGFKISDIYPIHRLKELFQEKYLSEEEKE
jgi:predicted  nucleic acid-binding Zn-ribbon protein